MNRCIFRSGQGKIENPNQISIPVQQAPYTMPLQYPGLIADFFKEGSQMLMMGPEAWLAPEYCNLGFRVLANGYDIAVPLKEHHEDPFMYTGLIWMACNGATKEFLARWESGTLEAYPWQAFYNALYESRLKVWYAPSTWWKKPVYSGMAVIIPCYNHEGFLPEAVRSAVRAKADQIIIVDDGSPGDVIDALSKVKAKGAPIYVIRQKNKGLPAARNAGARACTMSHFVPLDADDKISADYISEAKASMTSRAWLYGRVELFGDAHRVIKVKVNMESMTAMQPTNATVVVPKHAWQFAGGYDETIGGFESWDFLARLMQAGYAPRRFKGVAYYRKQKGKGMLAEKVFKDKPKYLAALAARSPVFFDGAFGAYLCELEDQA